MDRHVDESKSPFYVADDGSRPSSSSTASARKSQHSSVLSNKFNSLDERWADHKAKSPIKVVRARRIRRKPVSIENSEGRSSRVPPDNNHHRPEPSPGLARLERPTQKLELSHEISSSLPLQQSHHRDDDASVGGSTISTLSSTESVFERLHRQGIQSPRPQRSSAPSIRQGETQSLVSPNSTHKRRVKNRVEAYETRSLSGVAGSKTPRRRGTARQLHFLVGDDHQSSNRDAVFERLYRNEKRPEKLWIAPPKFTPKSSNHGGAGRSWSQNIANLDCRSTELDDSWHTEPIHSDISHDFVVPIQSRTIDTTLEEDLEAIKELGKQLGGHCLDDCSPTVAATSVSTNDDVLISMQDFLQLGGSENHNPDYFLTTNIDTVDENSSLFVAEGRSFEDFEHYIRWADSSSSSALHPSTSLTPDPAPPRSTMDRFAKLAEIPSNNDATTSAFFTLDSSSKQSFFAERIDRLSSPIHRRSKQWNSENNKDPKFDEAKLDSKPLLTPQRLRDASSVTVQKMWRMHLSEIHIAALMIQTWKTGFQPPFAAPKELANVSCSTRIRLLRKAIKTVRCWWILEGMYVEDNCVTIVWENEVNDGLNTYRVMFDCEATLFKFVAIRWDPRKVAILLVKAGLQRALRGENAARLVQRWYRNRRGYLNKAAAKLQRWVALCFQANLEISQATDRMHDSQTPSQERLLAPSNIGEADDIIVGMPPNTNANENSIFLPEMTSEKNHSDVEHQAAITIQSWLRISTLKMAVKEWPSSWNQLKTALHAVGCTQQEVKPSFDEFDAARTILYSTSVARRLGRSQFSWLDDEASHGSFVPKRASALAIHNIVRAYISGLKKFRDKQRATRVQAAFRGYFVRKMIERLHLAAVVIQFAWTNYRYYKVKVQNATKIQSFWRMSYCERSFGIIRFCVVYIQANWRRAMVRRRYLAQSHGTLTIQRVWKGHRSRKSFLHLKSAVKTIQISFREKAMISLYREHSRYSSRIQICWRAFQMRRLIQQRIRAARSIQAWFRGWKEHRRYRNSQNSVVAIQCAWRLLAFRRRIGMAKMASSVTRIQTVWRGLSGRRECRRRKHAAIAMQRVSRGFGVRNQLRTTTASITLFKATFRMRVARREYLSLLQSVVKIQASFRKASCQRQVSNYRQAIFLIQRVYRGRIGRTKAERMRWKRSIVASILIQSTWRACVARDEYFQCRLATILLQSVIRKMLARRMVLCLITDRRLSAATKIQTVYRAEQCRQYLANAVAAATVIQSLCRGVLSRQLLHRHHQAAIAIQLSWRAISHRRTLDAATKVQNLWRSGMARNMLLERRIAANTIQAWFRGARESMNASYQLHHMISAVEVVQSSYRMSIFRDHFMRKRYAVITIQSFLRGVSARRNIGYQHGAATKIAVAWNVWSARRLLADLRLRKQMALVIQRWWRSCAERNRFNTALRALNLIQTTFRTTLVTRIKKEREELCASKRLAESAAIDVQRVYRGCNARSEASIIIAATHAAVLIQRQWRASVAREAYMQKRGSLLLIQSHVRGFLTRNALFHSNRQYQAAVILQSVQRGRSCKSNFHHKRVSAIRLQDWWRRRFADREFKSKQRAAAILQRQCKEIALTKRRLRLKIDSVVVIQAYWRRSITQDWYIYVKAATIVIQAAVRGAQVREMWWFLRFLVERKSVFFDSASKIQIAYAVWKSELAVWEMKSLAVLLRRGVRGQLERSVVRYALFHVNSSTQKTVTTSLFRLAEKEKQGVLAISRWHRAVAHVSVSAATVIQSFVRGCIARKEVRDIFGVVFQTARLPHELTRQRDVAACTIQRTYRKWCQNRLYYVVLLQKRVRGWNARSITIKLRHNREILMAASATVIQTYQRRSAAQSRYRRRRAAVKIQSLWRHHEAQKFLNRSLRAIIVLQRFLRALAQKRKARQELIKVVILVQAVWRLSIQRRRLWRRSQLAKQMTAEVTAEIMSNSSSRCVLRVDNLLTGLESAPGPCLGRLVSRVNVAVTESTLSSASLISGLTTRGRSSTVPLPRETAASSSSEASIGEWKKRSSTSPSSMKADHGTSSAKSTSLAGSSPQMKLVLDAAGNSSNLLSRRAVIQEGKRELKNNREKGSSKEIDLPPPIPREKSAQRGMKAPPDRGLQQDWEWASEW